MVPGGWLELPVLPTSRLRLLPQVDKETNTETPAPPPSVVRPKDRRVGTQSAGPFLRGSTIIRSKTFSPGPQSQYVCRVSHSTYFLLSIVPLAAGAILGCSHPVWGIVGHMNSPD